MTLLRRCVVLCVLAQAATAAPGDLARAAEAGDLETVKKLLAAGVSPEDAKNKWPAVSWALGHGHNECAAVLLEYGARIWPSYPLRNLQLLVQSTGTRLAAPLLHSLSDERALVVTALTLAAMGAEVEPELQKALKDESPLMRRCAALAFRYLPEHSGASTLALVRAQQEEALLADATAALRRGARPATEVLHGLMDIVEEKGHPGRKRAIETLGFIGSPTKPKGDLKKADKRVRKALLSLSRNKKEEWGIMGAAKKALGPYKRGRRLARRTFELSGRAERRKKLKSPATEKAVEAGLAWLARHQDEDGRWDCDDFAKHDPPDDKCDGPGGALYDVGVTGLAVLAFLGAGYTEENNPNATTVLRGLRFLRRSQAEDGLFGPRTPHPYIYNHAIATLAMCEAYAMSRSLEWGVVAQHALDHLARMRSTGGAWGYEPRDKKNFTSQTAWCVIAVKTGELAGLRIDPKTFEGVSWWIERVTDPEFGQVGYHHSGGGPGRPVGLQELFPPGKSQSMTAAAMLVRVFLGEDPRTSEMIRRGADLCLEYTPKWERGTGDIDMYYWFYANHALFQVSGAHWKNWRKHLQAVFVDRQHPEGSGARTGSWDPIDPWGFDGGRVYSTSMMVMSLEVFYRYNRVFGLR